MLRDRLVWGIKDDSIQKKLLQEKNLTFQRALAIAQGSEAADRNLREMKVPKQELDSNSKGVTIKSEPVHKLYGKKPSTRDMGVTCHCCGTPGHLATVCRFRDRTCHKCGKRGYLAKVCRSKPNPKQPPPGARPKRPVSQPVRQVGEETDADSDDSLQLIQTLGDGREGRQPPIKVHVEVDNCSVPMEVDTGASVSIMAEATYHKLWPRRGLSTTNIRLLKGTHYCSGQYRCAGVLRRSDCSSTFGGSQGERGPPSWEEIG